MDKRFQKILKNIQEHTPNVPFWEKNPGDIFVYGTGTMGEDAGKVLLERGLPVRGYLDHKARITSLRGLPVMQPDDEAISLDERSAANIVLALHNPYANIPAISSRLKTLGYQHIINAVELYDYLAHEMGMRYWLVERTFYKSVGPPLQRAYNLLADDTSQQIFTAILEHRLSGNYEGLPEADWEHRYAPLDIPAWKSPMRLVDCGAFDGDSITDLQKAGITFEALAAFEPDVGAFQKLVGFFRANPALCPEATLWPCGVYSSTMQLKFDASQNKASSIKAGGSRFIQCVALDEALVNFAPTLIKMDIEGAEYEALLGMQQTIQQFKPGLAISLYHRPEHLWKIPLLVDQLANQPPRDRNRTSISTYKYFIRLHQMNEYDLVLYVVPTEE